MPLIIVTGLPSSGKSLTAQAIREYIERRLREEDLKQRVRIVTDSYDLDWQGRDCIYTSIAKEKELRGWLRAEAQRYINLDQIVILDAAAYIKGFRYELYCLSKEARTQYCIVERLIDSETCWRLNEARVEAWSPAEDDPNEPSAGYKRETFDALLLRYEECDEKNRWDSPLFRSTTCDTDQIPMERIYQVITKEEPLAQNKSTTTLMSTSTMYKPPR